ncbi:hypothetical protein T492DRAFT_1128297 [Pavlovales sp. CCMP2436]|nr:hypothetical protein T492DRAFT_1128297 [Pavlovales sp. CCMP2436]
MIGATRLPPPPGSMRLRCSRHDRERIDERAAACRREGDPAANRCRPQCACCHRQVHWCWGAVADSANGTERRAPDSVACSRRYIEYQSAEPTGERRGDRPRFATTRLRAHDCAKACAGWTASRHHNPYSLGKRLGVHRSGRVRRSVGSRDRRLADARRHGKQPATNDPRIRCIRRYIGYQSADQLGNGEETAPTSLLAVFVRTNVPKRVLNGPRRDIATPTPLANDSACITPDAPDARSALVIGGWRTRVDMASGRPPMIHVSDTSDDTSGTSRLTNWGTARRPPPHRYYSSSGKTSRPYSGLCNRHFLGVHHYGRIRSFVVSRAERSADARRHVAAARHRDLYSGLGKRHFYGAHHFGRALHFVISRAEWPVDARGHVAAARHRARPRMSGRTAATTARQCSSQRHVKRGEIIGASLPTASLHGDV